MTDAPDCATMTDGKRDFYVSGLQAGILSPEQQKALAEDLIPLLIDAKKMRTTLDELYQNDREQDEVIRALPVENIVSFPRRALPVRLATPPVIAVEDR